MVPISASQYHKSTKGNVTVPISTKRIVTKAHAYGYLIKHSHFIEIHMQLSLLTGTSYYKIQIISWIREKDVWGWGVNPTARGKSFEMSKKLKRKAMVGFCDSSVLFIVTNHLCILSSLNPTFLLLHNVPHLVKLCLALDKMFFYELDFFRYRLLFPRFFLKMEYACWHNKALASFHIGFLQQ